MTLEKGECRDKPILTSQRCVFVWRCVNAGISKDIQALKLHMFYEICIRTYTCCPNIPSVGIPRWALSRLKGSSIGGEGEVEPEVAGQLGGGVMGPGTGPVALHQAH